jgi:hypothetical protein
VDHGCAITEGAGVRLGEALRVAVGEPLRVPQALREGLREDNSDGDANAEPVVEEVTEGERDCVTLSV